MIAEILDKLFRGQPLTDGERSLAHRHLGWRPWWPALVEVAASLRTGRAIVPIGQPCEVERITEATLCMRPVFDQWKAARG